MWNTLDDRLGLLVSILFIGGILIGPVLGIVIESLMISQDHQARELEVLDTFTLFNQEFADQMKQFAIKKRVRNPNSK